MASHLPPGSLSVLFAVEAATADELDDDDVLEEE